MSWLWWTICLLGISVATAMPTESRDGKGFSLFSVVNFPNLACTTAMSNDMRGICVTAEECNGRSGTASGNCAAGFGVCCFVTVDDLTATIVNNMTYLVNPGYPSAHAEVTNALNYQYSIQAQANTAAIRLDFHTGVFMQPNTDTGACGAVDTVMTNTASSTATGTHTLCGVLTGQHMYLDNSGVANNLNTISIELGVNAFARTWKILVQLIENGNPGIVGKPTGCLQWFTGASSTVSSFNHNNGGALGVLNDDSYSICLRPEPGSNCVEWRQANGAVDSFSLDRAAANVEVGGCATTALRIPNDNINIPVPLYCGALLGQTDADTVATSVISDEHSIDVIAQTAANSRVAAGSGFELIYTQMTCAQD